MAVSFWCQHKGRSSWDTHPSYVTCCIRENLLCSRQQPCLFCVSWDERDWVSQDLRVEKIKGDWEFSLKQQATPNPALTTPRGTASASSFLVSSLSITSVLECCLVGALGRAPLSITRQSLDRALSFTQSQWSQPWQRRSSTMGPDVPLSLDTLKFFEALGSVQLNLPHLYPGISLQLSQHNLWQQVPQTCLNTPSYSFLGSPRTALLRSPGPGNPPLWNLPLHHGSTWTQTAPGQAAPAGREPQQRPPCKKNSSS